MKAIKLRVQKDSIRASNTRDIAEFNPKCMDTTWDTSNCMVVKEKNKVNYKSQYLINAVNTKKGAQN